MSNDPSPRIDASGLAIGATEPPYAGPERRRHRVFVTRNTEYHFRDGFCVAVRDRRSGEFLRGHLALRRRIQGSLRFFPSGTMLPHEGEPLPGEAIYFETHGRDLVTSPLERVERPTKEVVAAYPSVTTLSRA